MKQIVIDSAAWTGRQERPKAEPTLQIYRHEYRVQDEIARLAEEHGIEFASKVAAAFNQAYFGDRR